VPRFLEFCWVWIRGDWKKIRIVEIGEFPKSEDPAVGIALGYTDVNQVHIGILYKSQRTDLLLHLAWHHALRNDELNGNLDDRIRKFHFVIPDIPKERIRSFSALCKRISQRQNIPYGINYDKTRFTEEGYLIIGDDEYGLTCATFVMAVFKQAGFDLMKSIDWPAGRKKDIEWHAQIVAKLKETQAQFQISKEHIRNIESEIGCARFRPIEVAGASTGTLPSGFPYSWLAGTHIDKLLLQKK